MANTTPEQDYAIQKVAEAEGWDKRSTYEVGLLLWAIFRYYVWRLR